MEKSENLIVNVDEEFSKRITTLRFLLACLVVFVHGKPEDANFASGTVILEVPLWIECIRNFFSEILGRVAVPAFFVISGYLVFARKKSYEKLISSRSRTILIPYVFWTLFYILVYFVAQSFSFTKEYFANPKNIIKNWAVLDWLKAFVGRITDDSENCAMPLVYQFWYLRNLFLYILISPVISFLGRKVPVLLLSVLTIFKIAGGIEIISDIFWLNNIFYFVLGFYAVNAIPKVMRFLDKISWHDFILSWLFAVLLSFYCDINEIKGSSIVNFALNLMTIFLFLKFAGFAVSHQKIFEKLKLLSPFSFWIYATHAPFVMAVINKLAVRFFPMRGILILVEFFVFPSLCIAVLTLLGKIFKKIAPKAFAFVTGGRA